MKFKLTQNLGLKIGSIVFAAFLWVIVTNINNPVTDKPFNNIPVKIINTERLEEENKVYEVLEGTDIIGRVTVWAPTSVLGKISANNIVATADLAELSSLDTIGIELSLNNGETITRMESSIDIVKLKIEEQVSRTFAIRVETKGELAENYILGDIATDQNIVRITGPESLISTVVSAVAEIEVAQFSSDIDTETEIILLDEAGERVDSERIQQNIGGVRVEIEILEEKQVPINYTFTGVPAAGYQATGLVESSQTTVSVAGRGSVIRNFEEIRIPESVLDITDSTGDFVAEINLTDYLNEGVRLADDANEKITVTVFVEQESSLAVALQEERIAIINMPAGFKASISGLEENQNVTLIGLNNNLDQYRNNQVNGTIDIAGLMAGRDMEEMTEGFYTVEVDLHLAEGVTAANPIEVLLNVTSV